MNTVYSIVTFICSLAITAFSIPIIIHIAKNKKLMDAPDGRKAHRNEIPTLGGIGIFAGVLITTNLYSNIFLLPELQYITAAMIILFLTGMKDDLIDMRAYKKFFIQILAAFIIVHYGHIQFSGWHGFLGVNELPTLLCEVSSIFFIVALTNAFNLIDGIDTLCASTGILSSTLLGLILMSNGASAKALLAYALAGALLGFLPFNKTPARIFMGDTGSIIIGTISGILGIWCIELPMQTSYRHSLLPLVISILFIPIFDVTRVSVIRLAHKKSIFSADRNHLHHALLNLNFSHIQATSALLCTNALFIMFAWYTPGLSLHASLASMFIAASLLSLSLTIIHQHKEKAKSSIINIAPLEDNILLYQHPHMDQDGPKNQSHDKITYDKQASL